MTNSQMIVNLVIDPKSLFVSMSDSPRFWFPLLLLVGVTLAGVLYYYSAVDYAWLSENMMKSQNTTGTVSAQSTDVPVGISKDVMLWISITVIAIGIPLMRLAESTYYYLAGKMVGSIISFIHWLSLICWSSLPIALVVIVSAVMLLLHPSGQITQESLNVLSLNELFFNVPQQSGWYSLLCTLTVMHPWVWFLTAVGIREWTARSMVYSIVFSLAPWAVFYGGWALIVLSFSD
jgi:hypothetical protein